MPTSRVAAFSGEASTGVPEAANSAHLRRMLTPMLSSPVCCQPGSWPISSLEMSWFAPSKRRAASAITGNHLLPQFTGSPSSSTRRSW